MISTDNLVIFAENNTLNKHRILIVKGRAGLGNRMMSALNGILYSRLTGRRLIIDWSDHTYSNDGSNVFHRFFISPSCDPGDEIPDTDSVNPGIWRGHLHESAIEMDRRYGIPDSSESRRELSVDLATLDHVEDVLVMWTFVDEVELLRRHFKGEFKEYAEASRKEILERMLAEDLILHPQIRERVEQIKSNNFGKRTVGVHIRYTDYRVNLWSILTKLTILIKDEPDLQIFLATDSAQIKEMFEDFYSNVLTIPHWYGAHGSQIHQNLDCPDRMENGIEALIDLYLLAECDYLIIDTSSIFSYVASLVTKTPESNIFNVNPRERGGKRRPRQGPGSRLMARLDKYPWGLRIIRKLLRAYMFFNR